MNEEIRFLNEDRRRYDKRDIATALANSSNKDELVCGFIDNGLVSRCEECNVRDICARIDNIVEEQRKKNSKVVANFTF